MTHELLMQRLEAFKGKRLTRYFDEIKEIAITRGYTNINVMDPEFNTGSIDNERNRLNIRTDGDNRILSFSIG